MVYLLCMLYILSALNRLLCPQIDNIIFNINNIIFVNIL